MTHTDEAHEFPRQAAGTDRAAYEDDRIGQDLLPALHELMDSVRDDTAAPSHPKTAGGKHRQRRRRTPTSASPASRPDTATKTPDLTDPRPGPSPRHRASVDQAQSLTPQQRAAQEAVAGKRRAADGTTGNPSTATPPVSAPDSSQSGTRRPAAPQGSATVASGDASPGATAAQAKSWWRRPAVRDSVIGVVVAGCFLTAGTVFLSRTSAEGDYCLSAPSLDTEAASETFTKLERGLRRPALSTTFIAGVSAYQPAGKQLTGPVEVRRVQLLEAHQAVLDAIKDSTPAPENPDAGPNWSDLEQNLVAADTAFSAACRAALG